MSGTSTDAELYTRGTKFCMATSKPQILTAKAKFGIARAYFGVGRCSTRLSVLENLGVSAGIESLSYLQPEL